MQPTMPVPEELGYPGGSSRAAGPLHGETGPRKTATAGYDRVGWYESDLLRRRHLQLGLSSAGRRPMGNNMIAPAPRSRPRSWPSMDCEKIQSSIALPLANGVELFYANTGRKTGKKESVHVRFEERRVVCCWYGPDRLEAEPVDSDGHRQARRLSFLENEKRNFSTV